MRAGVLGLCLLVAAVTRAIDFDTVITTDESYWIQRSIRFGAALARGDLASTYRSGHPGVSVMWLGLIGVGPERLEPYLPARFAQLDILETSAGYLDAFGAARRVVAAFATLVLVLIVALAWKLFGLGAGILGGLLLLLDPYLLGMTRLLHVDALLTPLLLASTLAGLIYWLAGREVRYLVLSATLGGLALLTKTPAAFGPIFFVLVGAVVVRRWHASWAWFGPVTAWAAISAALCVALWPALWVQPVETVSSIVQHTRAIGGSAHADGNVFLGRVVTGDPGPLYYPVALGFRLSPLVLFGLAALPFFVWSQAERRAPILWLLAFAALFVAVMTVGGKKFDRYALPSIAALDLLGGVGLWRLAGWIGSRPLALVTCSLVVVVQAAILARSYPYPIASYNPLVGGVDGARWALLVGWGEGLEQVAAYLDRAGLAGRTVAVHYVKVIRPRFQGTSVPLYEYERPSPRGPRPAPDYVAVYVNGAQRGQLPPFVHETMAAGPPEFTARIKGVPYAWLYRVPDDVRARPIGPPAPSDRATPTQDPESDESISDEE